MPTYNGCTIHNELTCTNNTFDLHVPLLFLFFSCGTPKHSYGKRSSLCCCFGRLIKKVNKSTESYRAEIDLKRLKEDNDDAVVLEEAQAVRDNNWGQRNVAVEVLGLTKTFHKGKLRAVDSIAYGIDNNQLFTLLGHNGAGKTTTINMLVGNMMHSGGDATIFGNSISSDLSAVHQIMGYCPQHDVLYDRLTGKEHLELFANIKNSIYAEQIIDVGNEVVERLQQVNLVSAQHVQSGAYSGGMQRRLSIAIALIGDPKIVYVQVFAVVFAVVFVVVCSHVWFFFCRGCAVVLWYCENCENCENCGAVGMHGCSVCMAGIWTNPRLGWIP